MSVLIISDGQEKLTFGQILGLRKKIQSLGRKVDLFVLSDNEVFLNMKQMNRKLKPAELLGRTLRKKKYAVIFVSLIRDNFERLLLRQNDLLSMIKVSCPQTYVFIFGASSHLARVPKDETIRVSSFPRHGVSKVSEEFSNHLIDCIQHMKVSPRV